jgi:hypothetical protein
MMAPMMAPTTAPGGPPIAAPAAPPAIIPMTGSAEAWVEYVVAPKAARPIASVRTFRFIAFLPLVDGPFSLARSKRKRRLSLP